MPDHLTIINHTIEAHHNIRDQIKLVGASVTDLEALFSLQKADAGWSLSSIGTLTDSQGRLLQTLSALSEGLHNHFNMEEKALPPILGEIIMLALLLEHKEIGKLIVDTKSLVADTRFEGMNQEQLLHKKAQIQILVSTVLTKVEEHALKEETVLKMAQKALESKKTL